MANYKGPPSAKQKMIAAVVTLAMALEQGLGPQRHSGGLVFLSGFKLSVNHIEDNSDFALEASADHIILDGRGGAPVRTRKHLNAKTDRDITLVITGGLRVAEDFVKSIALGVDASHGAGVRTR